MRSSSPLLLLGLLLSLASTATAQESAWQLKPVASSNKLTASKEGILDPYPSEPVLLKATIGEWENFQFTVTAGKTKLENVQITTTGLASPSGYLFPTKNVEIYRENFVYVAHPSGNKILTPKWWPDALLPLELAPKTVEAGKSAAFWITLKIPEDAQPGEYFGEIDITAAGLTRRLPIGLKVEDRKLPPPKFRSTVALYYDVLRDWYSKDGRTFSDEEWALQKKRYYDLLLDYRINAYDLPVPWNSPEVEAYLHDPRVLSVRTPQLNSPDFDLALEKFKSTGTLKKAFYYWIDEPQTAEQFKQVREATAKLRPLGIAHLVTAHPNNALHDAVDIWCPNLGDYFGIGSLDAELLAKERLAGRETWFYTMIEPKYPHLTWLLDDDASAIKNSAAMMKRQGFTGFVYSMCHGWGPKPLENLESFQNTNGDGTLLYPAEIVGGVGPMPSIRLMLLRDAIEDFELGRGKPAEFVQTNSQTLEASGERFLVRGDAKTQALPLTKVKWLRSNGFLTVTFEANSPIEKEYVAVELAPEDASEKWRFILTLKGSKVVERRTREGAFRLPDFQFEGRGVAVPGPVKTWKYYLKIPLRQIPWAAKGVRFEPIRRTRFNAESAPITQQLHSLEGDPTHFSRLKVR